MDNKFLGRGLAYPVELTDDNQLEMSNYQLAVRQSIWIILGTAKGERVMRPDFGCGIHERVFGLNTARTLSDIQTDVREALVQYEPRIRVADVNVEQVPNEVNQLVIEISYILLADNSRFNLVYPFYLG